MATDSPLLTYLFSNESSFRKARLPALYSDFTSLRTLNPDGYTANITTWTHGLSSALRSGVLPPNLLILSLDDALFQALETKECGRPLALGTVVSEALSRKQFLMLGDFRDAKESIYRSKWAIPTLADILGWGLKQLGLGFRPKSDGKQVVVLENLEEAGKEFEIRTRGQRSRVDRVWSVGAFKDEFRDLLSRGKELSNVDFDVLLRYLQRDKGLTSWDGETVKLRAKGEADAITTEDASIANLKTLIADLRVRTRVLEDKVDQLSTAAKTAVGKGNRVAAISALRSKKLAAATLSKRQGTLEQLEEVFASIEQAADQVELVRVMEGSAAVLAGLNKEVGGVDRVDGVVDNLKEEMGKVDEIGNIIAEVGQVDEGEVDDELEALEREERRKVEEVERRGREERERREAEETKRRLDQLDEAEKVAREKHTPEIGHGTEKEVDESEKALKRISLDPTEDVPA